MFNFHPFREVLAQILSFVKLSILLCNIFNEKQVLLELYSLCVMKLLLVDQYSDFLKTFHVH